ncbi:programmed cell death protein 7 [Struthio camelus]|uniref:programmed cell death protein 7 n=1 Tax=Struthio camelus TaxID=8801 RepID=UPI0036042F35
MSQPPPFAGRFAVPPPPFRAFPPQPAGPFPPPPAAPFPPAAARPGPFAAAPPPFLPLPPAGPGPGPGAGPGPGPPFPPGGGGGGFYPAAGAGGLFAPWPAAGEAAAAAAAAEEEAEAALRRRDELWLAQFLARRRWQRPAAPGSRAPAASGGAGQARRVAAGALALVARLAALCRALRRCEAGGDEAGWQRARAEAEAARRELREAAGPLRQPGYLEALQRKARKARKKRLRLQQRKQEARAAKEEEAARAAEREAEIDRWRAKRIQEVEEKNRERELKAAADSVLSEVRKKQADTKRMVDILRALEKLRKLRKEAAGRKGVCPPPSADEAFENQVESLRTLLKNRTELYEAEERALRVMLEGEQEEERKREMEKKQKKEREKLLQQKREIDSKLFGDPDEFPLTHLLQPFRDYYLQAEHSVPALIQIRHEWDQYLVPADHPEGSCIPPGWVLPSLPTNDTWATAVR